MKKTKFNSEKTKEKKIINKDSKKFLKKIFYSNLDKGEILFEKYIFSKEIEYPFLLVPINCGYDNNFYIVYEYLNRFEIEKISKRGFYQLFYDFLILMEFYHKRSKILGAFSLENIRIYREDGNNYLLFEKENVFSENRKEVYSTLSSLKENIDFEEEYPFSVQSDIYSLGLFLERLIDTINASNIKNSLKNELDSVIERMLTETETDKYQNVYEIIREVMPLFLKNNIKIKRSKFFVDIGFNFFRRKQVERILKKLLKNKILILYGDEKVCLTETIDYLFAKLSSLGYRIKSFSDEEKIDDMKLKQENYDIIFSRKFFDNKKIKNKLVVFYGQKEFKNIGQLSEYKLPLLTIDEFKEYLTLILGKDYPTEIYDFIYKNAYLNCELIKKIILFLQEKEVIQLISGKTEYNLERLNKIEFVDKEYLKRIADLKIEDYIFLEKLAFYKQELTIKEIKKIFKISTLKILDFINELSKKDLLIMHSNKLRFQYGFIKEFIKSNSKNKEKISNQIINYLESKKLDFDEEKILLESYLEVNEIRKFLDFLQSLIRNYENDINKLLIIGDYFFKNIHIVKKLPCETIKILINLTKVIIKTNKMKESINIFNQIKQLEEKCSDSSLKNKIFTLEIQVLMVDRKFEKVINKFETQKDIIKNLNENDYFDVLISVVEAYYFLPKIDTGIKIALSLLDFLRKRKNNDKELGELYKKLGFLYSSKKDVVNAEKYYYKAIKINRKLKNYNNLGYLYSKIAWLKVTYFKHNEAEKYYNKARSYFEKGRIYTYIPLILYGLGYLYLETGRFWDALKKFSEALKLENKRGLLTSPFVLARTLAAIGYYEQALYFVKKSFKIIKDIKKNNFMASHYALLIKIYYETDKFKEIEKIYKKYLDFEKGKYYFMPHYQYAVFLIGIKEFDKFEKEFKAIKKSKKNIIYSQILFLHLKIKRNIYKKIFDNSLVNEILSLLQKIDNNLEELDRIYLDIYLYCKKTYEIKNVCSEYKKYIIKAFEIVNKRKNNLPTNIMRRKYFKSKFVREIVEYYEKEMITSDKSIILLDYLEQIATITANVTNQKELFMQILQIALKVTKAERGLILFMDNDNIDIKYSYQIEEEDKIDITSISKKIIKNAIRYKKSFFLIRVSKDKNLNLYNNIGNLKIESIICIPLLIYKELLGLIYLDSKSFLTFTPEEVKFLNILAQISASAIEISEKYCKLEETNSNLANQLVHGETFTIVGNSKAISDVLKKISLIAPSDVNVLIEGESGTGKELVAKEIHKKSLRKNNIFIPIDCGSLSEQLIESELFGYVKGAFTGAIKDKKGLFEEANNGTIFLDEISNLSLKVQAKLLRFLQEGEFKRIGDNKIRKSKVRIIAATNVPLKNMVNEKKFRADLYYRLSVFPIEIPPLRERKSDIVLLANYFINYFKIIHKKEIYGLTPKAIKILENYTWPGNVRELKNEIERAIILTDKKNLTANLFKHLEEKKKNIKKIDSGLNYQVDLYKYQIIKQVLEDSDHNWTLAARKLQLKRQSLKQIYERLKNKFSKNKITLQ